MSPWPWACLHFGASGCLPDCSHHRSSLLGRAGAQMSVSTLLRDLSFEMVTGPVNEPLATESHWILCPLRRDTGTVCLCPGFSVSRRLSVTESQPYDTVTGIQPRGYNPEEVISRDTATGLGWVLVVNLMSFLLGLAKYSLGSWVSSEGSPWIIGCACHIHVCF